MTLIKKRESCVFKPNMPREQVVDRLLAKFTLDGFLFDDVIN